MQDVGHLELIWLTVERTSRVGRPLLILTFFFDSLTVLSGIARSSVDLIWRKHPPHRKLEVHHDPPLKSFALTKQTVIDLMVFLIKILAEL